MTKRYAHAVPDLLHAAAQRLADATAPRTASAGDPVGAPSVRARKVARAGDRPTSRQTSESTSVPGGIRTHVTGVKGRPDALAPRGFFGVTGRPSYGSR